jgi:hypothetical protein
VHESNLNITHLLFVVPCYRKQVIPINPESIQRWVPVAKKAIGRKYALRQLACSQSKPPNAPRGQQLVLMLHAFTPIPVYRQDVKAIGVAVDQSCNRYPAYVCLVCQIQDKSYTSTHRLGSASARDLTKCLVATSGYPLPYTNDDKVNSGRT